MADLVYPDAGVRTLGSFPNNSRGEILPVTEKSGLVYARAERSFCHNNGLLHPVVHLHVIDRYSRLFLQKRSASKTLCPSMWDTAVGGHVAYGESVFEALRREAEEELGLVEFNPVQLCDYEWSFGTDRELVFVFAAVGNYEMILNGDEISEGRYWSFDEMDSAIGTSVFTPQFEKELPRIKEKLLSLL